jgi:ornithine cyclodeaminase/alanine dehydrogenase-like protein (mu-crystallin family)
LDWLTRGNVIYKSVGMGLMDLVVSEDLIRLGKERDVGVTVEDF